MTDPQGSTPFETVMLHRMTEMEDRLESVRAEVVGVRIDIATLKVKSGLWGAAFGSIPALATAMIALFAQGGIG